MSLFHQTKQLSDTEILIRPAQPEDHEALCDMCFAFCTEDNHKFGPRQRAALLELAEGLPHGASLLLEINGTLIGYVIISFGFSVEFGGKDALIDEIYVSPNYRGSGLGTKVLMALKEEMRKEGLCGLHLEVMDTNERAATLYARLGFQTRPSRLASIDLGTLHD